MQWSKLHYIAKSKGQLAARFKALLILLEKWPKALFQPSGKKNYRHRIDAAICFLCYKGAFKKNKMQPRR